MLSYGGRIHAVQALDTAAEGRVCCNSGFGYRGREDLSSQRRTRDQDQGVR